MDQEKHPEKDTEQPAQPEKEQQHDNTPKGEEHTLPSPEQPAEQEASAEEAAPADEQAAAAPVADSTQESDPPAAAQQQEAPEQKPEATQANTPADSQPPQVAEPQTEAKAAEPPADSHQPDAAPTEDATSPDTQAEESDENQDADEEDHDDDNLEAVDYTTLSIEELHQAAKDLAAMDNLRKIGKPLRQAEGRLQELLDTARTEALKKFIDEGGEEGAFDYHLSEQEQAAQGLLRQLHKAWRGFQREQDQLRQENLKAKRQLLEELRDVVDGKDTVVGLKVIHGFQDRWRELGPVPGNVVRELNANFYALVNRFHDQRKIYFELKDLDRKKNLDQKVALAEKAEQLSQQPYGPEVLKELDELHKEYKAIGAVPREDQEDLWQRFKAASDAIYDEHHRRLETVNEEMQVNLQKKQELADQAKALAEFSSDRITEWNAKTKELQALQKQWEKAGPIPRKEGKTLTRGFWKNVKAFFKNKGAFFSQLDEEREENLKAKQELLAKANELKDSTDGAVGAQLKELQQAWRNIGPVPDKKRGIYQEFKAACDLYFQRLRGEAPEQQEVLEANLKGKLDLIDQLAALQGAEEEIDTFDSLRQAFEGLGGVPKGKTKEVATKFKKVVEDFAAKVDSLTDMEKERISIQADIQAGGADAERNLERKMQQLRQEIGQLESDLSTWKTNLEFFASSKTADKLKAEFDEKIAAGEAKVADLKKQLRLLRSL